MNLPLLNQRIQHLVGAEEDGLWGPETAMKTLEKLTGVAANDIGRVPVVNLQPTDQDKVDDRSEAIFASLQPEVIPYMRALVHTAARMGITIVATSGFRSYDEQNKLYAQGRNAPGKIVTNARGGQSGHNFGIAVDFTVFNGPVPIWESPDYSLVGGLGKSLGLSWGGDWSNPDEPHFYLKPKWAESLSDSQMMAALRQRHDSGQKIYA